MHTYILKNEQLTVTCQTLGAEVISVKRGNCEYVWQGDPTYWKGKAPMLFPICGRLFGGKYVYEGRTYEMNQHGFMRNEEFEMVLQTEDSIVFVLRANERTLAQYPFPFVLTVTHTLRGDTVATELCVENTGEGIMPFTIGAHPGFFVPLGDEGAFEDYVLEFGEACSPDEIVMTDTCFLTGKRRAFPLEKGTTLPLRHSLFDIDAVFLSRVADSVTLRSDKAARSVTFSYPQMPYLGIWHAPRTDAPYICIEPWCGLAAYDGEIDDLASKPDMFRLRAGEEKRVAFAISYR